MKSATGDLFQQYLFQSLIMTLVLHYSHGAANFVAVPAPKIYVIKGGVARFLWTYKVDQNRAYDLKPVSPIWFYGQYNQHEDIGGDNGYSGWEFGPFNDSCPERLRLPIVRVSRESQATLVIKDVILADSGEYGCRLEIKNPENTASPKSTSKLIVTVTPKFIAHAKAITEVVENKDLTLNCTAVGPPTPAIRWFDVTNNQNVGTNDKGSSILHIQNIKRHQNGTQFKCLASNNPNEGEIGTNVTTVIVYYPPDVNKKFVKISRCIGDTANLKEQVNVDGNPTPTISCSHKQDNNPEFKFTVTNDNQYGNYTCSAKNALGTVEFVVKLIKTNISCQTTAAPPVTIVTPAPSTDGVHPGIIAGVVMAVILAIIGVVIAVIFWRRRKAYKQDSKTPKSQTVRMNDVQDNEDYYATTQHNQASVPEEPTVQYAQVDKSKKTKKKIPGQGELIYADLDHEGPGSSRPSTMPRPTDSYDENTTYADINTARREVPRYGNMQDLDSM